jgi:hypothetical protein
VHGADRSRLADGGGYQVCGLYNVSARSSAGLERDAASQDFGEDKEIYDGVDVYLSARLGEGVVVQGGTSTGRTLTDQCFVVDSPQALLNCRCAAVSRRRSSDWRYPLPWAGSRRRPRIQSLPGPQITAVALHQRRGPGRSVAISSAGANGTVDRTADRSRHDVRRSPESARLPLSQDLQHAGKPRIQANMDLFNAFNASACSRRTTRTDRRGSVRPTSSRDVW